MISTDPEFYQRRKDFKPRGFEHKLDNDGRHWTKLIHFDYDFARFSRAM
jgi:hypothetical protein